MPEDKKEQRQTEPWPETPGHPAMKVRIWLVTDQIFPYFFFCLYFQLPIRTNQRKPNIHPKLIKR